jgi:hypothetical protein
LPNLVHNVGNVNPSITLSRDVKSPVRVFITESTEKELEESVDVFRCSRGRVYGLRIGGVGVADLDRFCEEDKVQRRRKEMR